MMWYIFAILVMPAGNGTYGGPAVIDGFMTEQACIAHIQQLKNTIPAEIPQELWGRIKPRFEYASCIEKKVR